MGQDAVYMSTADGQVVALNRSNGAVIWRQPALRYRGLTAVAVSDDAVITADFQGYVHFLDKRTGAFIARVRSGKLRISNPPDRRRRRGGGHQRRRPHQRVSDVARAPRQQQQPCCPSSLS